MGKNKHKNHFWGGRDDSPKGDDMEENKDKMNENAEVFDEMKEAPETAPADAVETSEVEEENAAQSEETECGKAQKEIEDLKAQVEKEKKEYLFLMAEFDNFRKRTLREKSELIKNAAESAFKGLLPIVDDFERALKATEGSDDAGSVREGMELIYKKLKKYMEQNGVKEMDPEDRDFDADRHEAISAVPVPDESRKGKILDTVEKGYTINDKVLRHAKVVVGQ